MRFAAVLLGLLAAGCSEPPRQQETPVEAVSRVESPAERAMKRGEAFLIAQQSEDGGWRSSTYGDFKHGDALTPLATRALATLPHSDASAAAIRKGSRFLTVLGSAAGGGQTPLRFPVYTSAMALEVLAPAVNGWSPAEDYFFATVGERQLTARLGWQPSDPHFGGWGYFPGVPRRPAPGEPVPPFLEANTSATVAALQALGSLGHEGPCGDALAFLFRMQNYAEELTLLDDGGFFFIDGDPVRNKAGMSSSKERRYHSYGSATADGLRGMLLCGLADDHPRVAAAKRWLHDNFDAERHPGRYVAPHEPNRNGVYYYYAASLAQTLQRIEIAIERQQLVAALVARQNEDGSWANPIVTLREDDPITATSFALTALALLSKG